MALKNAPASQLGMTLLEVMVALAIFAVAGLAVMNTASQSVFALSRLEESTFATWIASNKLAELKLEKKWPSTSWTTGKQEMVGHQWHWRWRGVATEDNAFMAIDVEVRHDESAKNPTTTLRTYVTK